MFQGFHFSPCSFYLIHYMIVWGMNSTFCWWKMKPRMRGVEVLYHYGEFLKLTSSNSFKIRRENLSYLAIWVAQLPDNLQLKASESLMFMMCDQDWRCSYACQKPGTRRFYRKKMCESLMGNTETIWGTAGYWTCLGYCRGCLSDKTSWEFSWSCHIFLVCL